MPSVSVSASVSVSVLLMLKSYHVSANVLEQKFEKGSLVSINIV